MNTQQQQHQCYMLSANHFSVFILSINWRSVYSIIKIKGKKEPTQRKEYLSMCLNAPCPGSIYQNCASKLCIYFCMHLLALFNTHSQTHFITPFPIELCECVRLPVRAHVYHVCSMFITNEQQANWASNSFEFFTHLQSIEYTSQTTSLHTNYTQNNHLRMLNAK